jgi:hypothetical protein
MAEVVRNFDQIKIASNIKEMNIDPADGYLLLQLPS